MKGAPFTVIELNGAVEFDRNYDLDGQNVYEELALALGVRQATLGSGR